jgi:hypothetical protein
MISLNKAQTTARAQDTFRNVRKNKKSLLIFANIFIMMFPHESNWIGYVDTMHKRVGNSIRSCKQKWHIAFQTQYQVYSSIKLTDQKTSVSFCTVMLQNVEPPSEEKRALSSHG